MQHAAADALGLGVLVADPDEARPAGGQHALCSQRRLVVQRARRLVQQQELWLQRDADGKCHPLRLSTLAW